MNLNNENQKTIIKKNIHCRSCGGNEALLIDTVCGKKSVLKTPSLNKKYLLSMYFTFGLYGFAHGFRFLEKRSSYEHSTYVFCPHCGRKSNAGVRPDRKISRKVYLSSDNKILFGICGGIAEYTGRNANAVRLAMMLHGLFFFPAVAYFLIGITGIMQETPVKGYLTTEKYYDENYNGGNTI